jgi:hypothetical protein
MTKYLNDFAQKNPNFKIGKGSKAIKVLGEK